MFDNIIERIKGEVLYTEFAYDVKYWKLDDKDLFVFLKTNFDSFFKNYDMEIFVKEMISYFQEISMIAIEENINVDNKTVIDYLHLIRYNTIANNDHIFDYNIIKNKYIKNIYDNMTNENVLRFQKKRKIKSI